jgi:hypothetical protein
VTNPSRRLLDAAAKVLPHALHAAGRGSGANRSPQTLTIARPPADVLSAFQDPAVLSRLLGEVGTVVSPAPGEFTWSLGDGAADGVATRLSVTPDGVDFLRGGSGEAVARVEQDTEGGAPGAAPAPAEALVSLRTRPAPHDLGTEATLLLDVPTGAPAFTVLYRLRALLQTGEIPTISPQPAARAEDH